ncbi:UDP-3-O-acyl-N-acetylglucosamine deacetylase [Roseomonas sp. CCTCC AB2023176]|uniref:UDP-3-O-acyl-N-acetylglucosamine deacetylase n=1 Tax=Roseomonas sp. CCTCC AB2023176 TaxID=3342640 RepID=UPI0035E020DB
MAMRQATLGRAVSLSGAGLHTGRTAEVTLAPAAPDSGIAFRVLSGGRAATAAATWRSRTGSRMSTTLDLGDGRRLRTIEHLMAALSAAGLDNALVTVRGEEVPILDGSAERWCALVAEAGLVLQDAPRRVIRITEPVQVNGLRGFLRAEPHDGFAVDVTTDRLPHFGVLRWAGEVTPESFRTAIAPSRSFANPSVLWRLLLRTRVASRLLPAGLRDALWHRSWRGQVAATHAVNPNAPEPRWERPISADVRARLAPPRREPLLRGARPGRVSLVIGGRVIGGARFPDEPVRHKVLDLVGDLALAGLPLRGRFVAHVPTHDLTYALVAELLGGGRGWEVAAER